MIESIKLKKYINVEEKIMLEGKLYKKSGEIITF